MPTEKHRGDILRQVVENRKVNRTELAAYLQIDRTYLYKLFNTKDLPFHWLRTAGEFIRYDFSKDFPDIDRDLVATDLEAAPPGFISLEVYHREIDHWKTKYIKLLEEMRRDITPTNDS